MNPAALGARGLVRFYQYLAADRPSPCRYVPSCSNYAAEAIETHGALKGIGLTVWRLLRCNPWGGRGLDEVPPRRSPRPNRWTTNSQPREVIDSV